MSSYNEEFSAYISTCVNNGCTISLKTALEKINSIIVEESPRLTDLSGLKNAWKSRFLYIYNQMLKKNEMPPIDQEVSDDIWIKLYMDISKYEIDNYNKLSKADRQRVVARLYKDENEKFGRDLLSESSPEIEELPRKRKLISEEADYDELVDFNSSITDDTEKTDSTYKTEPSTGYAEKFKSKKYVLTSYELNKHEEDLIVYTYDEDSILDERLNISSIELNTVSPKYKLVPAVLNDEEYVQLRLWRRCIANDEVYFPPHATTIDQLNLNNLLSHVSDTVLKNDIDKSEIGFIANDISPIFRYLFPLRDLISYKWDKSSFKINNSVSQKLRLDFVFYFEDQEIGCGEVKVCSHNPGLLDNDRARIAETLKRQLHVRIMKCKDQKHMATFGMFCNSHDIELYIMSFDKEADQPYQLHKPRTLKIPSSLNTYTNMDETLEYLKSFKKIMISSLPNDEDMTKPFIYHEYSPFFKPTLSFKKE